MSKPRTALLLACLALSGRAAALEPNQILVLVNSRLPTSVALGRFYCDKRGVPEGNLVALALPEGDSLDPNVFDEELRGPLRQEMQERGLTDGIRCILTTWGVPFRLTAAPRDPKIQMMLDWWAEAAKRSQAALAADLERFKLVGEHFPDTATRLTDVERLEGLFEPTPPATEILEDPKTFGDRFLNEAGRALNRVRSLDDERKINIGKRQVLALYFHAFGLQGLQRGLETMTLTGGPDPQSIKQRMETLRDRLQQIAQLPAGPASLADMEKALLSLQGHSGLLVLANSRLTMADLDSAAAVDNELSLLLWDDYSREGQAPNLMHWQNQPQRQAYEGRYGRPLMVARLDGPSPAWAVRMVRDAMTVERTGLEGLLYIDLIDGADEKLRAYDPHLRGLRRLVQRDTEIGVKLERTAKLFAPGSCPDAALYVGWRSPREYVPAFTWSPGAVGFHIGTSEAGHLRDPNSSEWVPSMLAAGAAVTIGAADEPFLSAFPLPEEFFLLVLSGKMTVCEAYWRTVPHASWRMMFFGDPLYNPFRENPRPMRLPPGLVGESEAGGATLP